MISLAAQSVFSVSETFLILTMIIGIPLWCFGELKIRFGVGRLPARRNRRVAARLATRGNQSSHVIS